MKYLFIFIILASMLIPSSVMVFPYSSLGHILAFIIFGFIIKKWYYLLPLTVVIELIQPLFSRAFEWQDILYNIIGLILYFILNKIINGRFSYFWNSTK